MGSRCLAFTSTTSLDLFQSMKLLAIIACLSASAFGHEYFPGQCPNFTPMSGFDWQKFSSGLWFVTQKFATESTCLTYEFKTDELGFKSIEQSGNCHIVSALGWIMNIHTL